MLDDGTGEAHVWVSGALVRPLLGLDDRQWEGLQRALRVRGQVEVYPWGQNLVRTTSCVTHSTSTCAHACVFSRCVRMPSCTSCCVCAAVKLCVASSRSPAGDTTDRDQKVTMVHKHRPSWLVAMEMTVLLFIHLADDITGCVGQ